MPAPFREQARQYFEQQQQQPQAQQQEQQPVPQQIMPPPAAQLPPIAQMPPQQVQQMQQQHQHPLYAMVPHMKCMLKHVSPHACVSNECAVGFNVLMVATCIHDATYIHVCCWC